MPAEEPERSDGNPAFQRESRFLRMQKNLAKSKNPDWQIYLPQSGFAFCRDSPDSRKKNGSPGGDRTHDQLLRRQLDLSVKLPKNGEFSDVFQTHCLNFAFCHHILSTVIISRQFVNIQGGAGWSSREN